MKAGKDEGKATEEMLRGLETRLLAYLDEWRRELGIRRELEVKVGRRRETSGPPERTSFRGRY